MPFSSTKLLCLALLTAAQSNAVAQVPDIASSYREMVRLIQPTTQSRTAIACTALALHIGEHEQGKLWAAQAAMTSSDPTAVAMGVSYFVGLADGQGVVTEFGASAAELMEGQRSVFKTKCKFPRK